MLISMATEESLLVIRGLGIQTTSSPATYLSKAATRFIPTTQIQDIVIHEAFKGFEVRFYLAALVEGEPNVLVVFPVSLWMPLSITGTNSPTEIATKASSIRRGLERFATLFVRGKLSKFFFLVTLRSLYMSYDHDAPVSAPVVFLRCWTVRYRAFCTSTGSIFLFCMTCTCFPHCLPPFPPKNILSPRVCLNEFDN